jgi:hypothetical protein
MLCSVRCWRQPAAVLAAVTIFLTGCATGSSEGWADLACPAVVEYSRDEQRRVADEVAALPDGSVIVDWLADYAVLRAQVRACAP